MKKSIICLLGGLVAGIALCLATASMIPIDPDSLKDFKGYASSINTMRHWASGGFEITITSKPSGIWMSLNPSF